MPLNNARYSCAGICCYDELSDNKFLFKLNPISQFSALEILDRATEILIYIFKKLKEKLVLTKYSKDNHGKITLVDYDHTIGNILSKVLQDDNNIEFAAYK